MVTEKAPKKPGAKKNQQDCRIWVPAFTIQSLQKHACVIPPPKCNIFKELPPSNTRFRDNYARGNLPVGTDPKGHKVAWKADVTKLDYHYYLPMFFEGLIETEYPFTFYTYHGIRDLLKHGGPKIFPCIPQLIIPIKDALRRKNKTVMIRTLNALQLLVKSGDMIGEALVPYYRQLLPNLNIFKEINVNTGDAIDDSQTRGDNLADVINDTLQVLEQYGVNTGDAIDYSQMRGDNLADIINETLQVLEKYGGEDAFINIKYLIPTYESCMMN